MRVIIAEDSPLIRDGLQRTLSMRGLDVVAVAGTAEELVERTAALLPDAVLTDLRMPPSHTDEGLTAVLEIRRAQPGTGALLLSQYADSVVAARLLDASDGYVGYLLKERVTDPSHLCEALHRVAAGETVVDAYLVQQMLGRKRLHGLLDELSERERDVLSAMAEGLSNHGIGERLFLSPRTVEHHIAQVFDKLHLNAQGESNRRVLAVVTYLREGSA